ncbi:MAG: hypothetical protein ACRD3Y_02290 [Bryobacteraceae bacterium]
MSGSANDLQQRANQAVREALELAYLGRQHIAAPKIAARIFESEPDLMRELFRPWMVERLTSMIQRARREAWAQRDQGQMVLSDPVFWELPTRIFLRDGRRPCLEDCKIRQVEDHLVLLRQRLKDHPRVKQMEAVVALHRKWADLEDRGITWGDAIRREAEERLK